MKEQLPVTKNNFYLLLRQCLVNLYLVTAFLYHFLIGQTKGSANAKFMLFTHAYIQGRFKLNFQPMDNNLPVDDRLNLLL